MTLALSMNAQCTLHATLGAKIRWRSSLVSLPDLASLDLCTPVSPPRCETWIAAAAYPNRLRLIARPPLGAALRTQISQTLAPSPAFALIALSAALALSWPLFFAFCSPALVASVQDLSPYEPAVSGCPRRCAFLLHTLFDLFPFQGPAVHNRLPVLRKGAQSTVIHHIERQQSICVSESSRWQLWRTERRRRVRHHQPTAVRSRPCSTASQTSMTVTTSQTRLQRAMPAIRQTPPACKQMLRFVR